MCQPLDERAKMHTSRAGALLITVLTLEKKTDGWTETISLLYTSFYDTIRDAILTCAQKPT